eukprot:g1535.t1
MALRVNDRVVVRGGFENAEAAKRRGGGSRYRGTVKHVGALYVGIELDIPLDRVQMMKLRRKGNSGDGVFLGKRYFKTTKGSAVFVFADHVEVISKGDRASATSTKALAKTRRVVVARQRTRSSVDREKETAIREFREALLLSRDTFGKSTLAASRDTGTSILLRFDSILGTPRAALNEDDDGDGGDNNSTEDEIHIFREDYVVIIDDENDPCREDDIIITIIIDDDDENCPSILEGLVDSETDSETDNADTKSGNAKRGANENHADDAENRRRFRNESENISELLETTATPAYVAHAMWLALVEELRQPTPPLLLTSANAGNGSSAQLDAFAEIAEHSPHFRGDLPFTKYQHASYAPAVFRQLRDIFEVSQQGYLESISSVVHKGLGEGKSGSHFYFTADKQYVLKTVKPNSEVPVLLKLLKDYYRFFALQRSSGRGRAPKRQQQCSLLPRFFGLHKFTFPNRSSFFLIVMRNVLKSQGDGVLHRVFDLKGSLMSRWVPPLEEWEEEEGQDDDVKVKDSSPSSSRPGLAIDKRTLKDLNFTATILLPKEDFECLQKQLRCDTALLTRYQIMDYSLLLGVRFESRPPWMGKASRDVMPDKQRREPTSKRQSARERSAKPDDLGNAYLKSAVLKTYTDRQVMSTLLPEGRRARITIAIGEYAKVPQSATAKRHVVFAIHVSVYYRDENDHAEPPHADEEPPLRDTWYVYRRYSEFDRLATSINEEIRKTGAQCDRLPPKRFFGSHFDADFLEDRRVRLERWCKGILRLYGDRVALSPSLRAFLTSGANCPPAGVLLEAARGKSISESAVNRLRSVGRGRGLRAYLAPAGVSVRTRRDLTTRCCPVTLFFGVIDVLQSFDTKKRVESMYKSIAYNGSEISAIESSAYGERFIGYVAGDIFQSLPESVIGRGH